MKTWGVDLWVFVLSIICLIVYITFRVVADYIEVGVGRRYIATLACILGFIYFNTKRLSPRGFHVHLHHYVISSLVMTLLCYQTTFLTFVHGYWNGMAIEGGARYGFDAIWLIQDDVDNKVEIFERWFHTDTHKHSGYQRVKWALVKALQR